MDKAQSEIFRLSEEAESLAEFLERACEIRGISYRKASLEAGTYHGAIWALASGTHKRASEDTIANLALYFKVPEVNLIRLAGYTPKHTTPTYLLKEASAIYQVLTDEEKKEWIKLGELLVRARRPGFSASQQEE